MTRPSNEFTGKTLRINLRIGWFVAQHLVSGQPKISFEPLPVDQILLESREQNDDNASKISSLSRLSHFNLRRKSHSMFGNKANMFLDNASVKALHDFLETSPTAKASVPLVQNPTMMKAQGKFNYGVRVHINPITGGAKAYRSTVNSTSTVELADSQKAMRVLSNPHSDGASDDLIGDNSHDVSTMADLKIGIDPEAPGPRKKIREKDTKGLADLIASQGRSLTNLDQEYARFMDGA